MEFLIKTFTNIVIILLAFELRASGKKNTFKSYEGRELDIEEVPYIVLVIPGDGSTCTGSLIQARWVMTAAHCFQKTSTNCMVGLATEKRSSIAKKHWVERVIIHPQYMKNNIRSSKHDLALLKLFNKATLSSNIQTISLEDQKWPAELKKQYCHVGGFGLHRKSRRTGDLHGGQVIVAIARHAPLCGQYGWVDLDGLLLTYKNESEPICFGDSGAPLVCNGRAYGLAIESYICPPFRRSEEIACGQNYVDSYLELSRHTGWIRETISCAPTWRLGYSVNASKLIVIILIISSGITL